jgi:hypothetical protein
MIESKRRALGKEKKYSVAYFFAGIFLANGVPHFVHRISGLNITVKFRA